MTKTTTEILKETQRSLREMLNAYWSIWGKGGDGNEPPDFIKRANALAGWAIIPIEEVQEGTVLKSDDGFTCDMPKIVVVKKDKHGELYVDCSEGGHYLDGQLDDEGKNYVGFWKVNPDEVT